MRFCLKLNQQKTQENLAGFVVVGILFPNFFLDVHPLAIPKVRFEPLTNQLKIHLFKVNNRNTRKRCEICSK